ncbi:AraC family transcriptional regulator [Flavobacterium piscis]|uniref:AraC family transcriptional regulator n=1 Tax=Flavobacterium piscis TaxID=1114874 RepID=A0ABX2XPW0_9FLAO|nr:AraC family transcriptional regulator [Flavobacterium piscis]OCB78305.1 AraC family transcriptional regulator [Flavobacterium piscis]OXG04227.1 AraC family transcriptional regulator [Flavobacterium piscis]
MKKENHKPHHFQSISLMLNALGLPKPLHPMVALVDYKDIKIDTAEIGKGYMLNFYKISFKKHFSGKLRYGQGHYDFEEGGLSFTSPNQLIAAADEEKDYSGYTLLFHPDFIRNYPLGNTIIKYGFFSYSVAEALYLSDKEKKVIFSIFDAIAIELDTNIDHFSQDVLVTHIEQLLNYSNRFYNRQFITRKIVYNDLIVQLENYLSSIFDHNADFKDGIPDVQQVANHLKVSPRYLSDMLKSLTGQTTQQHIHNKIIERAKNQLSSTNLTIAEIAYSLGFEHPQSFNKLFKNKLKLSPLDYRRSFN